MKPLPFQVECEHEIDWFDGRALCALDQGLGKTFTSLLHLSRHPEKLPAIVVCPAIVKYTWEHEALRAFGWRSAVLEGTHPGEVGHVSTKPQLVVINYDILRYWVKWLRHHVKPRTIIIDECQFCASSSAKRTKATRDLCEGVPNVLALSGTPLINRPIELFPILNILRPDIFNSRWSFAQEYCDPRWTPWGWKYTGSSNTQQLNQVLLGTCMIRRRKVDVLQDLPDKLRSVVPVPLSNRREYRQADQDFLNWLRKIDPTKAVRAARAESVSKVGYLLRLCAELKLPAVVEWIKEFLSESDEKLVVFAKHRAMLAGMRLGVGMDSLLIDGSVTGRHRKSIVDRFQTDKRVRLLFGNAALGVGATLTAANNVAMTELDWTPGAMLQKEDRCHRIGTTKTVWIHYLVAHGTIEEKLCYILQQKQEILSSILDGGKMDEDLGVFDQLMGELQNEPSISAD